jgi:hypothetical protein
MLKAEDFINGIGNFSYKELEDIPIIGTVKVTDTLFGRLDSLINIHYNGEIKYFQLLMDFNKISDATEIKLGQILVLPEISVLENSVKILEIEDNVPGINKSMDNNLVNSTLSKNNSKSTKTTALPKLQITLNKVSYDNDTGILKL